ncbi:transcriptional regulator, LysR family protein [Marinomonas sp. MED121]|uniref:transcriptional regulator GcvA n=1 Tax=Marinomonas sp. MED121 TaxID=314277 RepID=UPI00006911AC|nr:transcriptional regulator GcvA [Marinomonas sp. MED121]EAQ67699.1 transcriptional regulator, LysR family protein [Marinomonas sp. MED121]
MKRLPPLKAMQAFEAAGRHQSLKKAADELCVTTGAISQQIKLLEAHLEVELFKRLNKSVRLTEAGRACLPLIEQGFELLGDAAAKAQTYSEQKLITISVAPSFGAKWLLPRLEQFRRKHPDIDLRIDASTRLIDFAHDDVDISIRYGAIKEKGMHVEALSHEELFPVCSPHLMTQCASLEALSDYPLLHLERRSADKSFPGWAEWIEENGLNKEAFKHGPRFSMSSMVLQAAIDGQGVAMASSVLAADDLKTGRLIRLFPQSLRAKYHYHLICTKNLSQRADVVKFIDWIKQEILA